MLLVVAVGLAGSAIDSALGAAFQAKYRVQSGNSGEWRHTERKTLGGTPLELAQGIRWVNNDIVNFASLLLCGAVSTAVW
jgi:uncharacterized membrane protein